MNYPSCPCIFNDKFLFLSNSSFSLFNFLAFQQHKVQGFRNKQYFDLASCFFHFDNVEFVASCWATNCSYLSKKRRSQIVINGPKFGIYLKKTVWNLHAFGWFESSWAFTAPLKLIWVGAYSKKKKLLGWWNQRYSREEHCLQHCNHRLEWHLND